MTTSIKTINDKTRIKRKYTRRKHTRKQVSQVLDTALPITPDQPLHLHKSCADQGTVLSVTPFQKRGRGRPKKVQPVNDAVNHPSHYTSHPSGIECITITEGFDFVIGNVIKYAWRAGLKGGKIQDLEKCRWYLNRAIANCESK